MSKDARPIIIKRVKKVEAGHHGGAWKVAYADFVTAMMAFFLLMWLLSSTSEETREGLAEFFAPNLALPATTTGGNGPFGGSSMFSEDRMNADASTAPRTPPGDAGNLDQAFWELEDALLGSSGDAAEADPLLSHIRTRLTDEGLIVEVFDIEGSPLFRPDTAEPSPALRQLAAMIGGVFARAANPVAVTGHLGAPLGAADPWVLSSDRAQVVRRLVEGAGVEPERLARVTGRADRAPAFPDLTDPRNRRVEITLLRRFGADEPGRSARD